MIIPGADLGSSLRRSVIYVKHFLPVRRVVDRLTLFVVVPMLVLVSVLVAVDHQAIGTFDNRQIALTSLHSP